MTDKPYTQDDVELVAKAIFRNDFPGGPVEGKGAAGLLEEYQQNARAVLAALAAAGRLLPADAETQWGVRFLDRKTRQPHSSVYPAVTEREARAFAVSHAHIDEVGEALKRRVTAWTPAPKESA